MKIPFVDLKAQYRAIRPEIDAAIREVLETAAFIGGPGVRAFEASFAEYCGCAHCVGVGNGTDALALALRAMGIGSGDEVIVPANSFVATAEAVTMAGASVVFCDVDPHTYNMAPERFADKITARTRAVIPVHLYGQPADLDPIVETARERGLKVLADAAQAHGSRYRGEKIATLVDATAFSFYPGKNLGAYGDAGAIVTDDPELAEKARMLSNHGRVDKFGHRFEGVNSRLDGLQAAVLSVKLAYLDGWLEKRRAAARGYDERLAGSGVATPVELPDVRAVYHLYVVRVPATRRDALRAHLAESGIATGIHYPVALPDLEAYAHLGHGPDDFSVAAQAAREILSLPVFPELQPKQISRVVEAVRRFFGR